MSGERKTALVIGANRGVGLAIVKALHAQKYRVWGTVRPDTMQDPSVEELRAAGVVDVLEADFQNEASLASVSEKLEAVERLDVLVNSGGVNTLPRHWNGGESMERMVEKFRIMAAGPFFATLHLIPLLSQGNPGKVLNISSDLASITDTDGGRISYRMAKASLNMQTASLAADFKAQGLNVAVVAVHPGRVPTRMSGGNGNVDLDESANSMVKILTDLTLETSGKFMDYAGREMAW